MAIPDLLWACPRCGRDRGLRGETRPSRCQACGTRFERVQGARIRATAPQGQGDAEVLDAADWVRRLPPIESLLDRGEEDPAGCVRSARVGARFVVGEAAVRSRGLYLNRMERYGPEREGTLHLYDGRLELRVGAGEVQGGDSPAEVRPWPFEAVRAVQTSSRSLQVRDAAGGVASFRFLDDSSFLWEQLLTAALRRFYRRTGRGEIVEFQPRITTA